MEGESMKTSLRRNPRALCVIAGLAVAAMLALGAPAGATVIGQEHYSGTDTYSFNDCGFWLDAESEFYGQILFRVDPGGEAFLVKDKFWYRDVLTNRDTGEWFVLRGNGLFHETKAKHIEGNVYEFTAVEAGQPFVIEDSAGKVIVRDRGVIRHTAIFDTLGDGVPSAEFIEETHTSVHGPHPGFADDFPFCEIAAELTGA
jgi:hypothetical protein